MVGDTKYLRAIRPQRLGIGTRSNASRQCSISTVQFHVNQIETHLRELYENNFWDTRLAEANNLSRILSAHAVNCVLGESANDPKTLIEVTDGNGDGGIDAIGIDPVAKIVVLVQSKWRQDGTGSMDLGGVLKFLDGARTFFGMKTDSGLANASEKMRGMAMEVMSSPGAKVILVTATTASAELSDAARKPIETLLGEVNDVTVTDPIASHVHLSQGTLFDSISAEKSLEDLNIDFSKKLELVPKMVDNLVDHFVNIFPPNTYPATLFKNQTKVAELLAPS